jgi:hypothetical protein
MGEISKLGRLMGLIEHDAWADSLYFLSLLLLSISKDTGLVPAYWDSLHTHAETTWIYL